MIPYYSIIVPAYNEEHLLGGTLQRLKEAMSSLAGEYPGELIVVDNNSNDDTARIARKHGAQVVFEPVNCIARSRNSGARAAAGEALVFVDADTIVVPELLSKTLQSLRSGRICGGGTLISFDTEDIPLPLKMFSRFWHFYIQYFPLAAGSYVFCLREAWSDIGGFDEKLYASEEIRFSRALRKWGKNREMAFKILDVPVVTSARKIKQFSAMRIFIMFLLLTIYPPGVKSRKMCHMWYHRAK